MKDFTRIYVATDGSAINNGDNTFTCAAGCVVCIDGQITNKVLELPNSTVNIAELSGVLLALELLEVLGNDKKYEIWFILDSEYTLKSVTKWYPMWNRNRKNGVPTTSSGTPVKNFELIEKIYFKLKEFKNKKMWRINSHIKEKEIEKKYHKFCFTNAISISMEEFLKIKAVNELCDELVQKTTQKMISENKGMK